MNDYKITYNGDTNIEDMHHIGVEHNSNYYSVLYGKYVNGGFFSIPNWNVGGELSMSFDDIFWNTESIGKVIKSKKAAIAIAKAIAETEKAKSRLL